jgi:hypothetical protein
MLSEVGFESLCKLASGQHDVPSTTFTFQTNICTQANHGPFVRAAWMLFPQAQMIVELQVGKHMDNLFLRK